MLHLLYEEVVKTHEPRVPHAMFQFGGKQVLCFRVKITSCNLWQFKNVKEIQKHA